MEDAIKVAEDQAWRDAYYIAWVGASNPSGVYRTMTEHLKTLGSSHPAVQAIEGHYAFLQGNGLGPDLDILDQVKVNAQRLGLLFGPGH